MTKAPRASSYAPDDETRADMLSSATELRSRGGRIIGILSSMSPSSMTLSPFRMPERPTLWSKPFRLNSWPITPPWLAATIRTGRETLPRASR